MDIDIEQCRENDKIKEIISTSGLPIKHIKLLLRLSDTIYINAINYNVVIDGRNVSIALISSKPENKTGLFHTFSIANILHKLREMEKENEDILTHCKVDGDLFTIIINVTE